MAALYGLTLRCQYRGDEFGGRGFAAASRYAYEANISELIEGASVSPGEFIYHSLLYRLEDFVSNYAHSKRNVTTFAGKVKGFERVLSGDG